jgi:hypothetical protein
VVPNIPQTAVRLRDGRKEVGFGSSDGHRGAALKNADNFHRGWIPFVHFGVLGEPLLSRAESCR